jgi:hypothetical protein
MPSRDAGWSSAASVGCCMSASNQNDETHSGKSVCGHCFLSLGRAASSNRMPVAHRVQRGCGASTMLLLCSRADVEAHSLGRLYCMRPPPIPTRSVSEGLKPVPRLRFGLVLNVSFLAASSISPQPRRRNQVSCARNPKAIRSAWRQRDERGHPHFLGGTKGAIHISLVPESGWPHPILRKQGLRRAQVIQYVGY